METMTAPVREVTTDHGRVYQPSGYGRTLIDWKPPAALAGHRRLTGGVITEDPAAGRIVRFTETSASKAICVRITPDRATLAELVAIAERIDGEIRAGEQARQDARAAARAARIAADVATFAATLPAGYIAIDEVHHNPSAGDGWGLTTYRHGGVDLASHEVRELDARSHSPLGEPYHLVVYAPADGLAALVARKRSEAAAKGEAQAARRAAADADRAAKVALARETGRAVELARWTEGCDGSADECSTDIVVSYAQPDGTVSVRRTHTH